jgi:DNA-binding CsgD family transcriptional regulator
MVAQPRPTSPSSLKTVGDVLNLPFNVFFMNHEGANVNTSEAHAETMGFSSVRDSVGATIFDIAQARDAEKMRNTDLEIMKSARGKIIEEEAVLAGRIGYQQSLTIKMPWYDRSNQIVGIFGCSIILGKQKLAESLSQIVSHDLLPSLNTKQKKPLMGPALSKRQRQCLYYLVRGKTAGETAEILGLSTRTVEFYLQNIKNKMNADSKSELIEKVLGEFNPLINL